jgi:hypothetical protein
LYATSNEVAELRPAQGSREVTPSSNKEMSFDVAFHSAKEGTKGGKKRHKQRPQGARTTTDHDDSDGRKAGGSDRGHIMTATRSDKRQVRPPIDHFTRLLEEACPNHAYPVRHKLKDYSMMKSFTILGPSPRVWN